ncbi:MAG: inositol monophosphatase family protein, partial [Spirochaetota bacterium]
GIERTEKSSFSDLVTNVDLLAQNAVCQRLESAFPGVNIMAEEDRDASLSGKVLVVDPLDGTLNFTHGYHEVAVSIGYWDAGEAVAGVVYNPLSDDMFHALRGSGAFRNSKPIRCGTKTALSQCLLVTGWPYDRSQYARTFEILSEFAMACQEVRVIGSAALDMCYVAAGAFDGYWEWDLRPWDLAGGAAIALEAGCALTSLSGAAFSLADGEVLVACPDVHREMLAKLRGFPRS